MRARQIHCTSASRRDRHRRKLESAMRMQLSGGVTKGPRVSVGNKITPGGTNHGAMYGALCGALATVGQAGQVRRSRYALPRNGLLTIPRLGTRHTHATIQISREKLTFPRAPVVTFVRRSLARQRERGVIFFCRFNCVTPRYSTFLSFKKLGDVI